MNVSRHPGLVDTILMAFGAMLAVYAGGLSIGRAEIGTFMAGLLVVTTLIGIGLKAVSVRLKISRHAGLIYAGLALCCLFFGTSLNQLMPQGGYPLPVIFASVFSWMVVFGALVSWTDPILCFQSVPAIAVFGLVGAFDTYRASPLLFFAFLLVSIGLFFRSHARTMLAQAEESLRHSARETAEEVSDHAHQFADKTGAWVWMAGPMWALGSALLIVLLSVIGAPVIRTGVQGATAAVRATLPALPTPSSGVQTRNERNSYDVGRGPVSFANVPLFEIKIDRPRYLAARSLYFYNGSGWDGADVRKFGQFEAMPARLSTSIVWRTNREISPSREPISFQMRILGSMTGIVPHPDDLIEMRSKTNPFNVRPDRTVWSQFGLASGSEFEGKIVEPVSTVGNRRSTLPEGDSADMVSDISKLSPEVQEFAKKVTAEGQTDFEKAMMLKRAIETQCKYSLQAKAVPPGTDSVRYFLFESKVGYCDLFASAMAMSARSIGLASRFRLGYLMDGIYPDRNGAFTVKDSDYHAWAEIYFQGVGWVVFDATQGAEVVESERGDNDGVPWYQLEWVQNLLLAGASASAIAAVGYIGWSLRHPTRREAPRQPIDKLFSRYQRTVVRRSGRPRRLPMTPSEYARQVATEAPQAASLIFQLNGQLEKYLFGPDEPTADDLKRMGRLIEDLDRELAKSKS